MISYDPLWRTMKEKGATTYTLRYQDRISGSTVQRLQKGESVSTNTLDMLCEVLNCKLCDVVEYIADE